MTQLPQVNDSAWKGSNRAFSLLEVLVSMVVFTLLLVLLFEALSQMGKVGQTVHADTNRVDNVGVAFDMMRRDLSNALMPFEPGSTNSLQFLLNPPSSQGGVDKIQNQHSAFWQAAVASDLTAGDIAVVGYFVRLDKTESPPRTQLCRLQIDASNADFLIGKNANWLDEHILNRNTAADPPEYAGLLVDNAIGLWMRAVDEDGNYYAMWDSREKNGKLPLALEVVLLVVDSRTAAAHLGQLPELPVQNLTATPQSPDAMDNEIQSYFDSLPDPLKKGVRIFRTKFSLAAQRSK